jgi:hypothetical protein
LTVATNSETSIRDVASTMKAYLITTGTVFALIVLSHVVRFITEGGALREPGLWLLTVLAAALSFWAWSLLRLASTKR